MKKPWQMSDRELLKSLIFALAYDADESLTEALKAEVVKRNLTDRLLAEVNRAGALSRAEQLARTARDLQRFAPGAAKPVGFSIGVALLGAGKPQSDQQIMELADRAMYQVKHGAKGGVALIEAEG